MPFFHPLDLIASLLSAITFPIGIILLAIIVLPFFFIGKAISDDVKKRGKQRLMLYAIGISVLLTVGIVAGMHFARGTTATILAIVIFFAIVIGVLNGIAKIILVTHDKIQARRGKSNMWDNDDYS